MVFKTHLLLVSFVTCFVCTYALNFNSFPNFNQYEDDPYMDKEHEFKPRIVQPTILTNHSLRFIAFIRIRGMSAERNCIGTIIAPMFVMTTYHCLANGARMINVSMKKKKKLGRWVPHKSDFGRKLNIAGTSRIVYQNSNKTPMEQYVMGTAKVSQLPPCRNIKSAFCVTDIDHGAGGGDAGGPVFELVRGEYVQFGMIIRAKAKRPVSSLVVSKGTILLIGPFCDFISAVTTGEVRCQTFSLKPRRFRFHSSWN